MSLSLSPKLNFPRYNDPIQLCALQGSKKYMRTKKNYGRTQAVTKKIRITGSSNCMLHSRSLCFQRSRSLNQAKLVTKRKYMIYYMDMRKGDDPFGKQSFCTNLMTVLDSKWRILGQKWPKIGKNSHFLTLWVVRFRNL